MYYIYNYRRFFVHGNYCLYKIPIIQKGHKTETQQINV